jgi:hypothetical protein
MIIQSIDAQAVEQWGTISHFYRRDLSQWGADEGERRSRDLTVFLNI